MYFTVCWTFSHFCSHAFSLAVLLEHWFRPCWSAVTGFCGLSTLKTPCPPDLSRTLRCSQYGRTVLSVVTALGSALYGCFYIRWSQVTGSFDLHSSHSLTQILVRSFFAPALWLYCAVNGGSVLGGRHMTWSKQYFVSFFLFSYLIRCWHSINNGPF